LKTEIVIESVAREKVSREKKEEQGLELNGCVSEGGNLRTSRTSSGNGNTLLGTRYTNSKSGGTTNKSAPKLAETEIQGYRGERRRKMRNAGRRRRGDRLRNNTRIRKHNTTERKRDDPR